MPEAVCGGRNALWTQRAAIGETLGESGGRAGYDAGSDAFDIPEAVD